MFPVPAAGVALGIVGEQTSNGGLSTAGSVVLGIGFALFAVVVMSGMLPIVRDLLRR